MIRCTIRVTASSLNVRQTPGTPLGVWLRYVYSGDTLVSINQMFYPEAVWYELDGGGWVHGDYVKILECDDDPPQPDDPPAVEHWVEQLEKTREQLVVHGQSLIAQGNVALTQAQIINDWLETHKLVLHVVKEPEENAQTGARDFVV